MDEEVSLFLRRHGLEQYTDYCNYHMALGLYCLYSIDALQAAEMVVNGEVFDETEVSVLLRQLCAAKKTLTHFQKILKLAPNQFDVSEKVNFSQCCLDRGRISGNQEEAVRIAHSWRQRFLTRYERARQAPETGEGAAQEFFLYEVAVYILCLAGTEISYDFLEFKNEFCRKKRDAQKEDAYAH